MADQYLIKRRNSAPPVANPVYKFQRKLETFEVAGLKPWFIQELDWKKKLRRV